ncbi:MAG: ATP-binding protein [Bacteroidales bacterium]|nr:MAG: ATP-binding protein [Bacteroidales bacterium]
MLLRLKIRNFLSFYEETTFDMFPNPKRTSFPNHIYNDMEVPLLKQAAIYGANGSGKSNFIKAMWFIKSFVTKDDFLNTIDLEEYRFQLAAEKHASICFEIEFLYKEKYFIYSTEIDKKSIQETLSLSGLGKDIDKLLFKRIGNEVTSDYLQNENSAKQLLSMNAQSSLLPLNLKFPVLSSSDVKNAYQWFHKQLEIIAINSTIPMLIDIMSKQPKLLTFANEIFENIGIGIKSVKIGDTPFEKWVTDNKNAKKLQQIIEQDPLKPNMGISRVENNRNVFSVSIKKGVETVQEFLFSQLGLSGYQKEMKITSQSDGTVRVLTLIPAFYSVVNEQKVIFIDEIDNSIHPNLMYTLLQFYSNTKSKGQLIFTTHTTKLLNQQELLRPDEIWLTEKENGNTRMYSINDFKIHNTINIENGYLSGRFGAIPQISDFEQE